MYTMESVSKKYTHLKGVLNERSLRVWCATEAECIGRGGVSLVHKATGASRVTISKGLKELHSEESLEPGRLRKKGGGRKKLTTKEPGLLESLKQIISPVTRGDPERPLLWSSKSTQKLSIELNEQGYQICQRSVYNLLLDQDYSLKGNRKTKEGTKNNPDRDAQFNYINKKVLEFQAEKLPVLSVDTKKKENIGNFKNNGREWHSSGNNTDVNVYDFVDEKLGKVAPYGVYDVTKNVGWVSVGISSDTAEFAVESVRNWWHEMGKDIYQNAKAIMITADCGGSNGNRVRLWKYELQKLANELRKSITVCHLPPGTSKWNKIEHRMFCHITMNWRARPLVDLQTVVELIGNTKTDTGLTIKTKIDNKTYDKGRKISKPEFESIKLSPMEFHGEWNYTISPNTS
jgi:hypothetical protein